MKKIINKIILILLKIKNFLIFGHWGILTMYSIKVDDKFFVNYTFIKGKNPEKELKNYLDKKYLNYELLHFNSEI
jgi:hypothetical protein